MNEYDYSAEEQPLPPDGFAFAKDEVVRVVGPGWTAGNGSFLATILEPIYDEDAGLDGHLYWYEIRPHVPLKYHKLPYVVSEAEIERVV